MPVRGVRGATSVDQDQPEEVLAATRELLLAIQEANPSLKAEDLASALFTVSDDLRSAYPAQAARQLGWVQVPLLCAGEIPVPSELPHCIRVLLHWNTDLPQGAIQHVYLRAAASLRPELANPPQPRAG
ncbi:MAG TPA: chorismate mutase [Anaerolineales bacterium]|nr:chorismate mutase [Anaerolineales bacterium]